VRQDNNFHIKVIAREFKQSRDIIAKWRHSGDKCIFRYDVQCQTLARPASPLAPCVSADYNVLRPATQRMLPPSDEYRRNSETQFCGSQLSSVNNDS